MHWGATSVKAARRTLMKLTPGVLNLTVFPKNRLKEKAFKICLKRSFLHFNIFFSRVKRETNCCLCSRRPSSSCPIQNWRARWEMRMYNTPWLPFGHFHPNMAFCKRFARNKMIWPLSNVVRKWHTAIYAMDMT